MEDEYKEIPIITVGRYKGTRIDQLPTSYCRWMLGQEFPQEWLEIIKRKVDASPFSNEHLAISRHAIDRFSMKFERLWRPFKRQVGLATFLVKLSEDAWNHGEDVSKRRHKDDGTVMLYKGMRFVFNVNEQFPEYKELITVM